MAKGKRGMALEALGGLIIVVAIIALAIFAMIAIKVKGISAIDYIKNMFKFR